ncbi:site-2 protease family protein [Leptolyngbya sp. FACHB-16]|uniref:site-2 protease family protein n=1 Tax=unclassified Leptolyngbya TaxID=2650499 RepID=UPI001686490C|nr:site-2 protease family protein [Leptolyngbya sp. FACHB-16]MBD2156834.1 tetratricopeptide repeat protein [Leptolyngbya sp. FACHB-16]
MLSLLYTIAPLLLILALPYLIATWKIRHTTMRCMCVKPAQAEDIPEAAWGIFKEAIAELNIQGFKMVSCHQIEQGSESDGNQWGILLQHGSGHTYAGLMTAQLVSSNTPLIRSCIAFFDDGTQLTTLNTAYFGIYSSNPREIALHVGTVSAEEQWQSHQQKLAELSQEKQPQILSHEAFLQTLEASNQWGAERLVTTGEVQWVTPGESYRMTWKTAIRAVYQVARKGKQKPIGQTNAEADHTDSNPATPIVELEIAEFHRLQQKQNKGLSQRGKNWLLLGTLALFIASYSSIFDPQRLMIFVAVLLFHEGGHILAMKIFGYRNTVMLFIPFLGALATARKDNASLTEKVWISLAGPLPGLILGIGLAIAFGLTRTPDVAASTWLEDTNWFRETSWMLIMLNLFNLLPIYPLDGGQVADLLLFSRNPYLGVIFKGMGAALLALVGLTSPLMFVFALLIAFSIPSSFRLAKLNARFRRDLRELPPGDRDEALRYLFTQLQKPPYQALPFAKKYSLVVGLLDTRQEDSARWSVRAGLTGVYLVSLLGGFAGGLYALMPGWNSWNLMRSNWADPKAAYSERAQQEVDAAEQALQTNPQDMQAYLRRGRARLALDNYDGAIADAERVLQLDPDAGEAYQLRGTARERKGDSTGGIADQERGMKLLLQQEMHDINQKLSQNSQDVRAYLHWANLFYGLQRYPEAIADCNRALLIDSQNIDAVLLRGEAYLALGQYPEATGNANHALRLDPDSANAYTLRSRARQEMGDENGAIADQQKATELLEAYDDEL